MKGNLFVVSGPSGSGKSTICKAVVAKDKKIKLSVSATTRKPRSGETDGVSYHFLTREVFEEKIARGEFYEHAYVYENIYGTLRAPVQAMREEGFDVILEIEMQGAKQIKMAEPDTVLIFIMPPSLEELAHRLQERNTETDEQIALRFQNAMDEISENKYYDFIVTNIHLEKAVSQVLEIIHSCREK